MFSDFRVCAVDVPGARLHARIGGAGPAVVLLHGYPQTHMMWHAIAPRLARHRTVVAVDLRGYGRSRAWDGDLTFRAMAADVAALLASLGLPDADVVAHDRGARAAHRLALDHPTRVRSLALLDILPTLDVWRLMDAWLAQRYWHWGFLAQPGGLPERLIGADPVFFLHRSLGALTGPTGTFTPEAMADYEAAARDPDVIAAWCADYRAGAGTDLEHDRADAGRTLDLPALLLWGERGVVGAQEDPLQVWRRHLPRVTGHALPAGHFLAEERPDEVHAALVTHLGLPDA